MTTTLSSYLSIANDLTKWRTITAKSPAVALQTTYFKANIGKVRTIDDLMKNTRLFNFAMTAFGLSDKIGAKALMRKVLEQGATNSRALANTLNDPRILAFARTFDFATHGQDTTARPEVQTDVVSKYVEQTLETNQKNQNPGVELAMYFRRQAPNVSNMFGVLADKKLLTVIQTALGISPLTSAQNIDVQARLLSAKLKLSDFQDPKKLNAFIARFGAMYDSSAMSSDANGAAESIAPGAIGMSAQLLLSLQSFRNRG